MHSTSDFRAMLEAERVLVVDGALATELEHRGHDLNHPLWSAKVLQDDPASIQQVHYDYYRAGANIAITASYQAGLQGLATHLQLHEAEGKQLIMRSVEAARAARDSLLADNDGVDGERTLLVAGSVGPYGAFLADGSEYRGDYVRTTAEFQDFHRARIAALIDAGVDLLAIETIPNLDEIKALLGLMQTEFPDAIAWLSCSMKDTAHLSDGTPWKDVLDLVNQHESQIVAFGIKCVALSSASDALSHIGSCTNLPLICYRKSGEIWESATHTWHGSRPDELITSHVGIVEAPAKLAAEFDKWTSAGARLIGGCCRTGPTFVKAIHDHLKR